MSGAEGRFRGSACCLAARRRRRRPSLGTKGRATRAGRSQATAASWTGRRRRPRPSTCATPRGEKRSSSTKPRAAPGQAAAGIFQLAAADGRRVLFTDENKLTSDSGAGPEHADLYECRIVTNPKPSCVLTDLTPSHGVGKEGAQVQGSILGASADGSYVYFVAKGVQSEAANARGQKAQAEKPNLYEWHEGQSSFVATLSGGDETDWRLPRHADGAVHAADARLRERPLPGADVASLADGL